jgi:hypothetical protein
MPPSREELLRQKALVEEQLTWLNRQLEETEPAPEAQRLPGAEVTPPPPAAVTHRPEPTRAPPHAPLPATTPPLDSPAQGLAPSAKWGCIGLALGLAALILFLLFGLPYLIY